MAQALAPSIRRLRSLSLSSIISAVILVVLLLPTILGLKDTTVGAVTRNLGGNWIVTSVDKGSIASKAGLLEGDVVVALDGLPPIRPRQTDPDLDYGQATEWTVLRDDVAVVLRRPALVSQPKDAVEPVVWLIVALSFWAVGAFVWTRKPEDRLARGLLMLCMAGALVIALTPAVGADAIWAKALVVVGFAALPGLFLDFSLSFALLRSPSGYGKLAIRVLYVAGTAVGAAYLLLGLWHVNGYSLARLLLLATLALAILGGLIALTAGYLAPCSHQHRRQGQIILIGAAVAFIPFIALSLLPVIVGVLPTSYRPYAPLSAVFLPAAVAYAILYRGFLAIDVIERTLVYAVMTLLLASCYALFLYGLGFAGYGREVQDNPVLLVSFFAAVTLTFVPVRDRVHRLIDHIVYGDRYDYASTLRALGARLAALHPLNDVLSTVVSSLAGAMNLKGAAILLRQPDGELSVRASSGVYAEPSHMEVLLLKAMKWRDQASNHDTFGHWIPLEAHGEESGLLVLGPKRSPTELSAGDLSMAETIASQTAVTVANALLLERLEAKVAELELLRDRLLHVQEEERKNLAQHIHDGPLQSTLDLVRRAEGLLSGPNGDLEGQRREQLVAVAERGRDAAHELRSVCVELYPSELDHLGLAAALESLTRRTSRDEDLCVRFITNLPPDIRLGAELEETLYRVAREAVANVCRHAKASSVDLTLNLETRSVVLSVRDNGCGFEVPAGFAVLLRRGHLGLASMRERVERLGGTLRLRSTRGAGTEVRALVPREQRLEDD